MPDSTAAFRPDDHDMPPDVPDFDLIRPIGQGGFGRVWLAANRTTGHLRAVKVISLHRRGTTDPAGREITSLTRLEANVRRRHPNLLQIHHVGRTDEHLFYVMDLADDVSGNAASSQPDYRPATLEHRLEAGPLSPQECFDHTEELLAGLASLHEAGMVHRDVKPANCLFVDGHLKLADFGLLTEAGPQISRVGTQKYMPPDGRMDARADVYAAGLVIYEMVTGLPAGSFPHLGSRAAEIAADTRLCLLIRLALDACQRDPQHRPRDARAMAAELKTPDTDKGGQATLLEKSSLSPFILLAACVVIVAAVVFWTARPPRVHVNFVTDPFEATIFLDGQQQFKPDGTPWTTPCTIEDLPARDHRVVLKHEQRPDIVRQVDFGEVRQIEVRWKSGPVADE